MTLGFVLYLLNGITSEGREVASYARSLARGEQVEEPSSFLGLTVAPSRGRLTVGDETFCVVRVSARVHLIAVADSSAPIETLIAEGDHFISDPDCA